MVASSDAANPRVPVPKSRVVSLSPTFAGRDLMLWRLKSHIWELSYWESPSAISKFTLFPFRTHQPKSELKLELRPGHVRLGSKADVEARPPDVRYTPESGHSLARCCERLHSTFPDDLGRPGRGKKFD